MFVQNSMFVQGATGGTIGSASSVLNSSESCATAPKYLTAQVCFLGIPIYHVTYLMASSMQGANAAATTRPFATPFAYRVLSLHYIFFSQCSLCDGDHYLILLDSAFHIFLLLRRCFVLIRLIGLQAYSRSCSGFMRHPKRPLKRKWEHGTGTRDSIGGLGLRRSWQQRTDRR